METHQSPLAMLEYQLNQEDMSKTCSSNVDECVSKSERLVESFRDELEQNEIRNTNADQLISSEETERKLLEKLELELATKEHRIATLLVETQKLQSTLIKMKETSFTQISDLENVVNGKEKLIAQLESKLQSQADYEQIKRELTLLKSIEYPSANEDSSKTFFEQNQPIKIEQNQIKLSLSDSESHTNHQQVQHSCRHCTSPCLHRSNVPFLPVPSLLSSSASSSSNSSSSPSSPSQIYLKTQSRINGNVNEELTRSINESSSSPAAAVAAAKFISPSSLSIITSKDNLQLCHSLTNTKYSSITSSCATMVTPTASLLSSMTTTTNTLTPSNLLSGHQLSSVQCTKLHCPPTSSWSPPLSSSSGVSSIATTSTDNRTVIKTSKQTSPKPSSSPTILVPSICPPVVSTNNNHLLEPLDTTYVANVVRKLLAQHNIGQRIFARYILSLSQGTVSELLSKPKCWSKLTEKGKESYRKMWCWANSEESILTLKSISPRKGMNNRSKDNPYPAVSTKHTDPATHQRIVQILADAQKQQMAAAAAMAANTDQKPSLSPCSSLPNDLSNLMPSSDPLESRSPSSSSASSTANSPLNESTPTDQKSFLLPPPSSSSTATAASLSMLSAFVPSLLMRTANGLNTDTNNATSGNLIDCSTSSPFSLLCHQPDNYRNWLMLQEIVRNNDLLKQFQPTFPPLQPLPMEIENETEHEDDDDDDDVDNNDSNDDDDDDLDDDNPTSSDEIPLDLSMKIDSNHPDFDQASITISHKHPPQHHSSTKHVKTALTPLREQDTSKYRYVNTMELVQTVKDILSRYSISQRHFGEKILGLSQGSVSDILARPKQWELLTQKGREPFLRMRIFLDDPTAIKQLVQTVSTTTTTTPTATNTSSILLPTFCPSLPSPFPPSSMPSSLLTTPSLLSNITSNGFQSNNLLTRDNSTDSQSNLLGNENVQSLLPPPLPPVPTSIISTSLSNGIPTTTNRSKSRSKNSKTTNDKPSNQSRSSNPLIPPYELPKIILPTTIDTEQLSSQVRELLFAYSIGQRVFGEAVLNLSQGTVSEILSKPRPWHSLSVKGREPYIRMYTWYNDANNVQKLLAWKRERDAVRRSRPSIPVPIINNNGDHDNGTPNSTVMNCSTTENRPKRRCLFTDEQRRVLKQIFETEPYPSQSTLEQLVVELALPMNKIANWFHNSRMRAKTNIRPSSISTSSLNHQDTQSDDEDDLDDNNNNNSNNNEIDDGEDEEDDDEDDYPTLPTIVPLTSSWLNGTNDSNSSSSPIAYTSIPTNIIPLIEDQKLPPLSSSSSSSSKKRKSIPQKLVSNFHSTKKFHPNSPLQNNDSNDEVNPTTNESSTHFVDILT